MTAQAIPPSNVIPLPQMPEQPAREPKAGDLVAAWCSSWSETHNGSQPDATVVRRVAGICKAIAKDRTDLDSWRAAWFAAKAAGRKGRFDIVSELCEPVVQTSGRANHFLAIAQSNATPLSDQLAASLAPRQLEA